MVFLRIFFVLLLSHQLNAEGDKKTEASKDDKQVLRYKRPYIADVAFFAEPFHSQAEFDESWILSSAKKDGVEDSIAKYDGKWAIQEPKDNPILGDNGLVLTSQAKHAAIASPLKTHFRFEDKPLIVQYEVRFQNKHECGGAYMKLLADSPSLNLNDFNDKVEYTIMFGPDKCGGDGKLHFIFQHKNPITHKMEEKHANKPSGDFNKIFDDNKTHLLTLIVRPDNSFEILVDRTQVSEGSLLKDMTPAVNPPKEIDDPEDKKAVDWDEREKIPDPDATKPDNWDEEAPKTIQDPNAKKPDGWLDNEPELIPDPAAVKPEDWNDEEDGEWEAPQINNAKCKAVGCGEWTPPTIKNPNYKGKWSSPLITNPNYKGIWKPRKIENPDFFEDSNPFAMKQIAAVGFELWSMQSDILFDNIIIADDLSIVDQWTQQTWELKHSKEAVSEPSAVSSMWKSFKEATDEKPWLWVIIVSAVLLPVVLIYFFCFSSKEDKTTVHKKTDDVVPDDEDNDDVSESKAKEGVKVEEVTEETKESSDENKESKEKEKATEDVKEEDKQEEENDEKENEEDSGDKSQEEKDADKEVPESGSSPRTRANRRKTRKDT